MKFIFDTDGTVTDFNEFLEENAYSYFIENYDMTIVNKNALELEDIFDMENFFIEKNNCTKEEAMIKTKEVLDKYWISFNFVKFSLLHKFRENVNEFINEQLKLGFDVEIHTSRSKTTDKSFVGKIARDFTIQQYLINGIKLPKEKFNFYKNDEEKIAGIIQSKPTVVFEDKPSIIEALTNNGIKVICIKGNHNDLVEENENIKVCGIYKNMTENVKDLVGEEIYDIYKLLSKSEKSFSKYNKIFSLAIKNYFHPEVLNLEKLIKNPDAGVIYAPNHVSTLDPFAINYYINDIVHWTVLARFMRGEDSIFNNSKNPMLCHLTKVMFENFGFFPVERTSDCENVDNSESLKNMKNTLVVGNKLGIFPEGTTRKKEGEDFGEFKKSFYYLANKTGAYIQPITISWYMKNDKKTPLVNFSEAYKVDNMSVEEAMKKYLENQKENLIENKLYIENQKNNIKRKKY